MICYNFTLNNHFRYVVESLSIVIIVLENRRQGSPNCGSCGTDESCFSNITSMASPPSEIVVDSRMEKCFPGFERTTTSGSLLEIRINRRSCMNPSSFWSHRRKISTVGPCVKSIVSLMEINSPVIQF